MHANMHANSSGSQAFHEQHMHTPICSPPCSPTRAEVKHSTSNTCTRQHARQHARQLERKPSIPRATHAPTRAGVCYSQVNYEQHTRQLARESVIVKPSTSNRHANTSEPTPTALLAFQRPARTRTREASGASQTHQPPEKRSERSEPTTPYT